MVARNQRNSGVRSLERGLALLVAMNRRKLPSVVELANDTRLPRPTIYRLLETLESAGFVQQSRPSQRYCLTSRVRALSDGFAEDDWIARIAAPLMRELTKQVAWPASLMTLELDRMLERETTHYASTLSVDYGKVGRSLPILRTAAGRCYLAFCPSCERAAIIGMLSRSRAPDDRMAREPRRLMKLLDEVRAGGYAIQDREINPKTTAIASPIQVRDHIVGSISIIWISSAMTIEDAKQRLLPSLLTTTRQIGDKIGK